MEFIVGQWPLLERFIKKPDRMRSVKDRRPKRMKVSSEIQGVKISPFTTLESVQGRILKMYGVKVSISRVQRIRKRDISERVTMPPAAIVENDRDSLDDFTDSFDSDEWERLSLINCGGEDKDE